MITQLRPLRGAYENASTEKASTNVQRRKVQVREKIKYDWAGVENASTNSAGKAQ